MRLGVDFTAQDFLGAGDRKHRHLGAQRFLGAENFLLDFGFRSRDDAIGFSLGCDLRLLDYRRAALLRLRNDLAGLCTCALQFLARALRSEFEILLATLGGREAFSDLLLARLDGDATAVAPGELRVRVDVTGLYEVGR